MQGVDLETVANGVTTDSQSTGKISRRSLNKGMAGVGAVVAAISSGLGVVHAQETTYWKQAVGLPKEKLAGILTKMLSIRKWETKFKDLFLGGQDQLYGYAHLYIGEEAIATGVTAALNDDDYITSTHRGHGHLIAKGGDLNAMSAEMFGRVGGSNLGYGGSMHIVDMSKGILGANGIVGAGWPLGAGAAYGIKVRGTKQVAVSMAGEGSTNSMYFMSSLRNATLYKLPFIAVVENNYYNISNPYENTTPLRDIADYSKALGIPGQVVDGNDVMAVYGVTKKAVERARAGEGPSLIEAKTYRWYDHAMFAGAKVGVEGAFGLPYRSDNEVRHWMAKDPIARFKAFLLDAKVLTEGELARIENDVQAAVDASIEYARSSPHQEAMAGLRNVYAEGLVAATQLYSGLA